MTGKMSYLTFLLASIRNKPGRNLATIFCFSFIAVNIFSAQFLIAGASGGVEQGVSRMGADHLVVPAEYMVFLGASGPSNTVAIIKAEPSIYRVNAGYFDNVGNVSGVSGISPQLYVSTMNAPAVSSSPVDIFGIDPVTDFTIRPWLRRPLDKNLGQNEIFVGSNISRDVSSQIQIKQYKLTIVGKLDPTQSSIDDAIFLRLEDAYALAAVDGVVPPSAPRIQPGDINALLVRDSPGQDLNAVNARIKREFSGSNTVKPIAVIGRHFALNPISQDIQGIPKLLNVVSIFVVIIAFPLIALIAAMVAHERQREIGLFKSMGATRKTVFSLVLAESLVLAAIGGIAGVVVSMAALLSLNSLGFLNSALQVSFRTPESADIALMAGVALFVVIVIGGLSSLWPAYRSSAINTYDAIRKNE